MNRSGLYMDVTHSGQSQVFRHSLWGRIVSGLDEFTDNQALRRIGLGLMGAAAYYGGTKIGFALTPDRSPIAAVWPPNAMLLAVFLLVSKRSWWILILAVLPVHLFIQLKTGIPLATSIGWFISNIGEALLGAALIRRFADPRKMFDSLRGTLIFLCLGVVVAPLTTSFVDAATVVFTGWGERYWWLWTERSFSNGLSELVVVPIIVTFWVNVGRWIKESTPARYLEAAALGIGLLTVSFLVFSFEKASSPNALALIYLPVSFLLWSAFRFGSGGLSLSVATVALISIEGAMHGRGPFTSRYMEVSVRSLQLLLSSVATPLILLTAVITERRKIENSLREVAQELIGAQEDERERIGRELHDDIGQQLAYLESELDELKDHVEGSHKSEVVGLIEKVADASRSTRELSHALHPSSIKHLGLEVALKRLCHQLATKKSNIRVYFESEKIGSAMPADVALCLYRISQEALHNVVRHSGASELSVTLIEREKSVRLRITDNGAGFEVDDTKHVGLGLMGMRERVRVCKGHIWISSSSGTGTTLEVDIPLDTRL